MLNSEKTMDKIVALCKGRGYVYAGSEIYGGLANTWDYGPLGVEFKNNVKKAWWKKFIQDTNLNVGIDCAILMNPETWVASGHVGSFSDPLMDCKECKARHRADKLIEDFAHEKGEDVVVDGWSKEEMEKYQVLPKHLEGIVQQLRATKDVEAAIFLYENEDGSFKASMRSSGKVDVAVIMMSYGGGGHIRAAGATIEGNAKEILEGIVKDVEKQLLK